MDQELVAKLESELAVEKEIRDSEQLSPNIQDFLDTSSFKLEDTPGVEEVVLTRQFGDETIRVAFSTADLHGLGQDVESYADDKAQYDEQGDDFLPDTQSGGAQSKGVINSGRTKGGNLRVRPEDEVGQSDESELEDEAGHEDVEQETSFPVRLIVTVEKPGKGALQIEAIAEDGTLEIDNVLYYPKAELADAKTADLEWSKKNLYAGPPFGNLDEDLQVLMERYLEERGIDTALALWVPEYIDFKEQREYLNWLSNVKSFVEA